MEWGMKNDDEAGLRHHAAHNRRSSEDCEGL
jgi:hypothetical protein